MNTPQNKKLKTNNSLPKAKRTRLNVEQDSGSESEHSLTRSFFSTDHSYRYSNLKSKLIDEDLYDYLEGVVRFESEGYKVIMYPPANELKILIKRGKEKTLQITLDGNNVMRETQKLFGDIADVYEAIKKAVEMPPNKPHGAVSVRNRTDNRSSTVGLYYRYKSQLRDQDIEFTIDSRLATQVENEPQPEFNEILVLSKQVLKLSIELEALRKQIIEGNSNQNAEYITLDKFQNLQQQFRQERENAETQQRDQQLKLKMVEEATQQISKRVDSTVQSSQMDKLIEGKVTEKIEFLNAQITSNLEEQKQSLIEITTLKHKIKDAHLEKFLVRPAFNILSPQIAHFTLSNNSKAVKYNCNAAWRSIYGAHEFKKTRSEYFGVKLIKLCDKALIIGVSPKVNFERQLAHNAGGSVMFYLQSGQVWNSGNPQATSFLGSSFTEGSTIIVEVNFGWPQPYVAFYHETRLLGSAFINQAYYDKPFHPVIDVYNQNIEVSFVDASYEGGLFRV